MSILTVKDILDARPKPFVFVLMPFDQAFTDVYELGIKKACEEAGAYAERLDEQMFKESMLQRIYNQIAKADVIVAEMTGRNPNVFYEVGYAHALGKAVILLAQKGEDIPFDLKHYRHIIYPNITELQPQLETAVRWGVKQVSEGAISPKSPIALYHANTPLVGDPIIESRLRPSDSKVSFLWLDLTYGNTDEVNTKAFMMSLWTSQHFEKTAWKAHAEVTQEMNVLPVCHPDGMYVFNSPEVVSLLPGAWGACHIIMCAADAPGIKRGATEKMVVRISMEAGSYDHPFTIKIL